jgi:hypothetical protein
MLLSNRWLRKLYSIFVISATVWMAVTTKNSRLQFATRDFPAGTLSRESLAAYLLEMNSLAGVRIEVNAEIRQKAAEGVNRLFFSGGESGATQCQLAATLAQFELAP